MKLNGIDRNIPLDAGIAVLAASILAGLCVLVLGNSAGKVQQDQRHAESPPASGQVSDERHQNISGPAAR